MRRRGEDPSWVGIHPGRTHWRSMQVSQPWLELAIPAIFIIPLGAGEGSGRGRERGGDGEGEGKETARTMLRATCRAHAAPDCQAAGTAQALRQLALPVRAACMVVSSPPSGHTSLSHRQDEGLSTALEPLGLFAASLAPRGSAASQQHPPLISAAPSCPASGPSCATPGQTAPRPPSRASAPAPGFCPPV